MKTLFLTLRRGIPHLIIFFLFLLNSNLFSQVTIKERVEINPDGDTKINSFTRGYTPCGPYIQNTEADHYWQVVWGGYWAPLDPSQQLFGLPYLFGYGLFDSYDVEIIEGAEHCTLAQPVPIEDIENGWTLEPLNVTELEGLAAVQLTGSGTWMYIDCVPRVWDDTTHLQLVILYDYIEEDEAAVTYSIYCHQTMEKKYFHTLIVKRRFVFEEFANPIRIPHAELDGCTPQAIPVFCSSLDTSQWYEDYDCKGIGVFHAGGDVPDNTKFSASIIEGGEYGTLSYFDGENQFTGDTLANMDYSGFDLAGFLADGEEPEDTGIVKIHVSSTDPTIPPEDVYLHIVPNPAYPLRVTFEPSELAPGDTAIIRLEKRVSEYPYFDPGNAEYEEFSEGQMFDINIIEGKEYGTIYSDAWEDTADEFEEMPGEFKFIAKDSINVDSVEISLRVSAYIPGIEEGGGACSILPGDKNIKQPQEISLLSNIINKISSQLTPDKGVIDKSKNLNDSKAGIMTYYNPINGGDVIGIGKA